MSGKAHVECQGEGIEKGEKTRGLELVKGEIEVSPIQRRVRGMLSVGKSLSRVSMSSRKCPGVQEGGR